MKLVGRIRGAGFILAHPVSFVLALLLSFFSFCCRSINLVMSVIGTSARILLAVMLTCAVGALYYDPELNPLAKVRVLCSVHPC